MTFIQSRVSTRFIASALFAIVAFLFISTATAQAATLNGENFNTHSGSDYKGINVGFNISDFENVESVSVSLYLDDTFLVENTHNDGLLDLINTAGTVFQQHSTPFIIQAGDYVEEYWNLGDFDWSLFTKPNKAVVKVNDVPTEILSLSETTATYESLLATPIVAYISNQEELEIALSNLDVATIELDASFEVDAKILIDRPVIIDGNGFTISSNVADNTVWNSATAYIFQAYNVTDVVIKDIKLTNANAGLLVNGSTVTLEGTVDVSGNGFGGIESSAGSVLTVSAATLVNDTEAYGLPTIWEDGVTGTTVEGFSTTGSTAVKSTQMQYYLGSEGVVRNEAQLNAALSNGAIAVITIGEDFDLTSDVDITRSVSIDGNDKTLFTIFEKTDNSNNSGLSITADNVDVKDLTIDGTDGTKLHGINVFLADSVTLSDVSLINNSYAGMVVNGSTVTVTNITTRDNVWGGINVDQGSDVTEVTTLTVNGTSAHTEAGYDIWRDSNAKTDVSVDDVNSQYDTVIFANNSVEGTGYTLKAPVQPSTGGGGGGRSSMRDRDQDEDEEIEVVEEEDETKGEVLGAATSTPTTTVAYYTFTVDFGIGSTGTDVTNLQTILMAAGFLDIDAPTGYFGQLTFAAVQKYQSAHMIPNTGFVGPLTRAQLNTTPIIGAAQTELIMKQIADLLAEVAKLQAELNEMLAQ